MPLTTLVDTDTVARHLGDPQWAVVDCRFRLDDVKWGEAEYRKAHIPGAMYTHLDRDLSGDTTGLNGRHPLPDPATLARTLGRLGIGADTQVVAYDQDSGTFASRLWWLLRWLGHDQAAVLDGGFARWVAEGRSIVAVRESRASRTFSGRPRRELTVDASEVLEMARQRVGRLVDAREPQRYRGEVETIDKVAGHIPGASNHHFKRNLGEDGRFSVPGGTSGPVDRVVGRRHPDNVVSYCGSGVTACHNLLALEHAGLTGARFMRVPGASGSSDPADPIERG